MTDTTKTTDTLAEATATLHAALASSAPGKILPDATTAGQDNA